MQFDFYSQHSANDHSNYTTQPIQPCDDSIGQNILSTHMYQDTSQNDPLVDFMETQGKNALNQTQSLNVNMDPALCQHLDQNSAETTTTSQQLRNSLLENTTKGQVSQPLKSSIHQVVSEPNSSNIGGGGNRGGKSVKFDPFHIEMVVVFETSHPPNQVPRSNVIKCLPFKVVYSQWAPTQHILFQHEKNVQLKRSLTIFDGSTLHGQVLVRNLGYEKQVEIRYTLDGWQTVKNAIAEYRHSRGSLDVFAYDIPLEQQGMADRGYLRATLDLAVRYTVMISNDTHSHLYQHGVEETFWDNNDGHNYQIQVVDETNKKLASSPLIHASDRHADLLLSSESCYNFGKSLIQAKHKTKPRKTTVTTDNNHRLSTLDDQTTRLPAETQSTPSSPTTDFVDSSGNQSLASSSYSDLIKKYCFYGSQDASSSSLALFING